MTVFKTFWKIVKKYKGTIILYVAMLVIFGGINLSTNETGLDFVSEKPDILIVNSDDEVGLTKNFIEYISENANIVSIDGNEEAINDALFYRDVNYVIYIPNNYRNDILNGKKPEINIKSTGDYEASLAEMMVTKYIKIQNIYVKNYENESDVIMAINNNLKAKSEVSLLSKVDVSKTSKLASYYNFSSYSMMAINIYIICLVIASFHKKNINNRTIISSMNYQKNNRYLLISSLLFSIIVWLLFIILGYILLGPIVLSSRGFIYILNLFVFMFSTLTLALLISSLVNNKNAINGIVNVVALGSAFLCGAFVPASWLPNSVLSIAHILPAYWFINTNDRLKTIETINFTSLKPLLLNMIVILIFAIGFIIINNLVSRWKLNRKEC